MKIKHILMIVFVAILLMASLLLIGDLSNYTSIEYAQKNAGKEVSIICKLDTTQTIVYDVMNHPNFFSFYVTDSLGGGMQVEYKNSKPTDIERVERLVIKGSVREANGVFDCKEILMKCPSKYNNDQLVNTSYKIE